MSFSQFRARFYTSYSEEATVVESFDQLLFEMERFFDELQFPFSSTNSRSFQEPLKKEYNILRKDKVMRDEQLLMKHGDLGSFIIRVQHRQNSSWQGRITWVEKNQTVMFRSVWEMVKLIESGLDSANPGQKEEPVSWPDN